MLETLAVSWSDAATASAIAVAILTGVLAIATFSLARVTRQMALNAAQEARATTEVARLAGDQLERADRQLELTATAVQLSVVPIIADVPLGSVDCTDDGTWPAPDRSGYSLRGDEFYISLQPPFHCSLALRNVGAGIAVITRLSVDIDASVVNTSRFVPAGEHFRIDLSLRSGADEQSLDDWRTSFTVVVEYQDLRGQQSLVSRIHVAHYATSGMKPSGVAISRVGEAEPFIVSGDMSYPY